MNKKSKASKAKTAKADPRDLAAIVTKIKRTFRDDICNIIRRGALLQQAKDQIEHGGWLTWVETNFNWDEQMAQRALSVAKFAARDLLEKFWPFPTQAVVELNKTGNVASRPRHCFEAGTVFWSAINS
jgi:Protein of unknown function (DUF3102)